MLGLNGKIARINLTNGKATIEELNKDIIKKYLGGIGIAMRLFYDEVPPEVKPFDPENKLIFMIGALTSLIPSTTRHVIVGKSPLSGILGESYSGGYWAYELRKAGLDGIIIEGKAPNPVYIWIKLASDQGTSASQDFNGITKTLSPDERSKAEALYEERKKAIELRQQEAKMRDMGFMQRQ